MKKKRVLITGAAGFIGYHTALRFFHEESIVLGVDNFNNYYDPKWKYARAKHLKEIGIVIKNVDISEPFALLNLARAFNPTHIIHLAAQAGVRYSLENPRAYLKSNIDGFLEVLETCREHPSCHLLFASSSSVYGLNEKTPYSTEDPTESQASLYGVTKKSNELMARTYSHLFGIKATGLRFFTVYGPFGRPDMAYFSFTKAILENEPLSLFNEGNLSRDFTYIDDIVEGIFRAAHVKKVFDIYNLGGENPTSLRDFLAILEELLGKKALIKTVAMQKGDVLTTFADMQKSFKDLGFKAKTPLKEGLEKFITWYQKNLNSSSMEEV
jgi:UDP-glucuronate 4-epimerase